MCEPKYQLLIQKREDAGVKHLNDPKAWIEYLNTMDDVYNNIHNYNLKGNRKIFNCVSWHDCWYYD